MGDLLPCPFCGAAPRMIERPASLSSEPFAIACSDDRCCALIEARTKPRAILMWSRRAAPPAQAVSVPVHEVIVRESLIREAHQKICNWIGAVAINGSHSGAAYSSCKEVVTKLASNLSDEARETLKMIDALRSDEADSVTILCDNQEFNGQPNCAIEVCGAWTNFEPRRFAANTLQLCLMGAVDAKRIYAAPAAATREGKE